MRKLSIPFFRIFYSGTYTTLLLILLVLLGITPGDLIYQTFRDGRLGNIFVVAVVYAVTAILAIFIYASRLYTNRTTLSTIPKPYVPIEDGEVGRNVRGSIVKNRQRSAIIAWESRPRDLGAEPVQPVRHNVEMTEKQQHTEERRSSQVIGPVITFAPHSPPWGHIVHPGWSAPSTDDFPDLQFETVISELPNLIEAKAVSLAPPDPTFNFMDSFHDAVIHPPDPRAIALLQRPLAMGMREYLAHLEGLGLINPPTLGAKFLSRYEYSRFSTNATTDREFRELMDVFSHVLAGMTELNPRITSAVASIDEESNEGSELTRSRSSIVQHHYSQSPPASSSGSSLRSSSSVIRRSPTSHIHFS